MYDTSYSNFGSDQPPHRPTGGMYGSLDGTRRTDLRMCRAWCLMSNEGFKRARGAGAWHLAVLHHMEPVRYLDVYVWEQYRQMYGCTDLPPSLPLPPADPFTRIRESSHRRFSRNESLTFNIMNFVSASICVQSGRPGTGAGREPLGTHRLQR